MIIKIIALHYLHCDIPINVQYRVYSTHSSAFPSHWSSTVFRRETDGTYPGGRSEPPPRWTPPDVPVSAALCRWWAAFLVDRIYDWWALCLPEHELWTGLAAIFDADQLLQSTRWCRRHSWTCTTSEKPSFSFSAAFCMVYGNLPYLRKLLTLKLNFPGQRTFLFCDWTLKTTGLFPLNVK